MLALESIVDPVSLYEPVYSDGGEPICVMDQIAGGSTDGDWIDEMAIRDALEELSDREKRIIRGSAFFEGKNPDGSFPARFGISQAQVSRLEKRGAAEGAAGPARLNDIGTGKACSF